MSRRDGERQARERFIALACPGVICGKCGATLETFDNVCSAALDEQCPGFLAIEQATAEWRRKRAGG